MDDNIGDIRNTILDAQKSILLQLEEQILDVEVELYELHDILATLDVVVALAAVAKEHNFTKPVSVQNMVVSCLCLFATVIIQLIQYNM